MCDRYASPDQASIEREWNITRHSNPDTFRAMFEVPPSRQVPVIWQPDDVPTGELELLSARWGLIPHSWTASKPPVKSHNVSSETAATHPMWKRPLRNARCIVPAAGWYEWPEMDISSATEQVNYRFYVQSSGRTPIGFAGMISWWVPPRAAAPIVTCAILTGPAAPSISHLADRMPIALAESGQASWLEPGMKDAGHALEILNDCATHDFVFHNTGRTTAPIAPEPFKPYFGNHHSVPNLGAIVF